MEASSRVFVTGHRGLVGSALVRSLLASGHRNLILHDRRDLDLTDPAAVRALFEKERPEYVFHAAARVGGILANATYPADFIYQNLVMQANVIHEAHRASVKRLLFLGSSCIYPKHAPQPIAEELLLSGSLEPTNRPYAVAKISGIEMCWAYNRQHGSRFLAAMLTSIYGPGDSYDSQNSHVIPALLEKMHEAKIAGAREVQVWGTGSPRREFLFSDDAAEACLFLARLPDEQFNLLIDSGHRCPIINVGSGSDLTVAEVANLVASVTGYDGQIFYDPFKPDGTPQKLLDVGRMSSLGWRARTALRDGLALTYLDYCSRKAGVAK